MPQQPDMATPILKRSVVIAGRKTSISLEEPFWRALQAIARRRAIEIGQLVRVITDAPRGNNVSSDARCFIVEQLQAERDAAIAVAQGNASEADRQLFRLIIHARQQEAADA